MKESFCALPLIVIKCIVLGIGLVVIVDSRKYHQFLWVCRGRQILRGGEKNFIKKGFPSGENGAVGEGPGGVGLFNHLHRVKRAHKPRPRPTDPLSFSADLHRVDP